ncbi:MAG: hypothetical protein ACXU8N_15950 [Telluria sp.]
MKTIASLFAIAGLAALTGCATQQPGPPNYGTRVAEQSTDPHQWHTVSVTPVNLPPDAPRPANVTVEPMPAVPMAAPAQAGTVTYSSAPVVIQQPAVVVPGPVIVEDPYYAAPPFSWSLGIMLGRGWGWGGRHHGGWRGGVGVGIHGH